MFLDEEGIHALPGVAQRLCELDVEKSGVAFPSETVWSAFARSIGGLVTIDRTRWATSYAAGGISVRDKRSWTRLYSAAYVFDGKDIELNLASVILEGSKSGASAAGVWLRINSCRRTFRATADHGPAASEGPPLREDARNGARVRRSREETIVCLPLLSEPDFNIVCMAFKL